DVPVRAHEQVAGVVGVQVEDGVDDLAARDDQAALLGQRGREAERATGGHLVAAGGPVRAADIGHPVRGPQPLERVRYGDLLAGPGGCGPVEILRSRAHAQLPAAFSLAMAWSTPSLKSAIADSDGSISQCPPSLRTVRAAVEPATSSRITAVFGSSSRP